VSKQVLREELVELIHLLSNGDYEGFMASAVTLSKNINSGIALMESMKQIILDQQLTIAELERSASEVKKAMDIVNSTVSQASEIIDQLTLENKMLKFDNDLLRAGK